MAEEARLRLRVSITASHVSEGRVNHFLDDYLEGRRSIGAIQKSFQHVGAFATSQEEKDGAAFGFNVLLRKGPLVDGSNWVEMTGWEFAVAEERHLAGILLAKLSDAVASTKQVEDASLSHEPQAILLAADELSKSLRSAGYDARLIVLATSLKHETTVELLKLLDTPDWDLPLELQTNWILGEHRGRLLLYLHQTGIDRMYAVDLRRFAKLTQFNPMAELVVSDVDRSVELLQQGILDPEDRVHLKLYQSYEVSIQDARAVWGVSLLRSADTVRTG